MWKLLGGLDLAVRWLLLGVVGVMVALVAAQVMARYGLNASIGWADEISRLAFVWCVFLGMPVAVRARAHIGLDLITAAAVRPLRAVLARLVPLACAALSLLVAWESLVIALDQWDERMISLELSAGWFLVPVAAGGAICALHFVAAALRGEAPAA
jgi:TRAP-type C4-dicarboxylate transport system permease small subunit